MEIAASEIDSAVIGLMLAGAGALIAYFLSGRRRLQDAMEARDKRIAELELRLGIVAQTLAPISGAYQAILVKELTHYHTPDMDALLVKLGPPNTLTEDDAGALTDALAQRTLDMGDQISDSERDAARMLPMIIKRAKAEAHLSIAGGVLKLVLIPDPSAPEKSPATPHDDCRENDGG